MNVGMRARFKRPFAVSLVQRFADYAAAFERTVETNELSHIEPFFCEDAVYQIWGGPPFEALHEGRDAIFASLLESLDNFDRRFDGRGGEALERPPRRIRRQPHPAVENDVDVGVVRDVGEVCALLLDVLDSIAHARYETGEQQVAADSRVDKQ